MENRFPLLSACYDVVQMKSMYRSALFHSPSIPFYVKKNIYVLSFNSLYPSYFLLSHLTVADLDLVTRASVYIAEDNHVAVSLIKSVVTNEVTVTGKGEQRRGEERRGEERRGKERKGEESTCMHTHPPTLLPTYE